MLRKAFLAGLLLACLPLLAGCTPHQRGYVVAADGQFTLKVVSVCQDIGFERVGVKYTEPDQSFEDLHTVWQARIADGTPVRAVTLFENDDVLVVEAADTDIDLSREMVIWWDEGDGFDGSISGVIASVPSGSVLWEEGIEAEQEFESRQASRPFGC